MGRLDGRVAPTSVSAIAPGGIDTDTSRAVMTPESRAKRIGELPVRRLGEVGDVAHGTVFLAAEQANYLTDRVLQPSAGGVMA
jgi:NAD(P)-dependent dehydrogenase (short-subunit alcohol dehydrogenase family)